MCLSDKHEPEDFGYEFDKDINELLEIEGGVVCKIYEDKHSFYNISDDIKNNLNDIKIYRSNEEEKDLSDINFRDN